MAPADALLGFLTTLLLLPAAASAASLTLYLPTKPNPFSLPPSTHATLSSLGTRVSAPLSAVNTFVFHNVSAGSYLVDVHCQTDAFHPLRLDVGDDGPIQAWETYRGNDWANKGEAVPVREGSAGRGVDIRALGSKSYFMERPTCEFERMGLGECALRLPQCDGALLPALDHLQNCTDK